MNKPTENQHPIHALLKERWSPRAYASQPVAADQILSLFEAARWAPLSNNSQPWAFIVTSASDPEPHAKLVSTLAEFNQMWSQHAPVLVLGIARTTWERDPSKTNTYALYDLGQAVAHLSIQASALGLSVHQMAGFDPQKAREAFNLPEAFAAVVVFTIGYAGDPATLPDPMRERELAPRTRKPLSEFVFDGAWQVALAPEAAAAD
jgi:nitroreductase